MNLRNEYSDKVEGVREESAEEVIWNKGGQVTEDRRKAHNEELIICTSQQTLQ